MMSDGVDALEEAQNAPSPSVIMSEGFPVPEQDQNVSPTTRKDRLWKKSAAWRARVGKNVGTLTKNVGNQLQKVNLAKLIDELEHDQELADKLEFINQETKEEADRKDLVRQATEACHAEIENHLEDFLERCPDATYEDWILDLHPDNVEQGRLFENFTEVDLRFYVKDSDHRLLWNRHEKVPEERHVAARTFKHTSAHAQPVDLLDDYTDNAPSSGASPNFTAGMESEHGEDQPSGSSCDPCASFWPDNGDM